MANLYWSSPTPQVDGPRQGDSTILLRFTPIFEGKHPDRGDWKYTRIYNPQRRLRILVERFRKDSSHTQTAMPSLVFEIGPFCTAVNATNHYLTSEWLIFIVLV
ncbi:hypothetical protein TNCV_1903851 [Trichonephila clavipes]|nr:hypothetical protein TNCV_1903851 [Trichonephila clavipes]